MILTDLLRVLTNKWYGSFLSILTQFLWLLFTYSGHLKCMIVLATVLIKDHVKGGGITEAAVLEDFNILNLKSM